MSAVLTCPSHSMRYLVLSLFFPSLENTLKCVLNPRDAALFENFIMTLSIEDANAGPGVIISSHNALYSSINFMQRSL